MSETSTKLEVWVTKFQNQDRMTRQRALKEFLEFCEDETNLTKENCTEMFDTVYLYIIKCYSDRFEMCRSLACSIITELLKRLEKNDYYLNYIVPVIAKRIGQVEIVEESEEVRLQLLQQLNFIIEKYKELIDHGSVRIGDGKDVLLKPYNDIIDILKVCLDDSYPAILKECCSIIKTTSEASTSFHYRAESLVDPLGNLLKHRQSPVRIAGVQALTIVCLNIHTNPDCVKKIISDVCPLLMDQVAYVRRECGRAGCTFLLELKDRYSFFERILPLVLTCLSDDTPDVQREITEEWKKVGELYYKENEDDLQKQALIDRTIENYPNNVIRPTLGCRAVVKRSLKILDAILREMEDWKEEVRLHSTKLLKQIVIHSEDYLASKYWDINAVLCKTCMDSDAAVVNEALDVSRLIGIFVDANTWSKYILEEMKLRKNKMGILKCLRKLFEFSDDPQKWKSLDLIVESFMDSSICHNNDVNFQLELFQLLEIILEGWEKVKPLENWERIQKKLYIVLLKSTAVGYEVEELRNFGNRLLDKLSSQDNSIAKVSGLHSKYIKSALVTLDALDRSNDDSFEQIVVLHGIICLCGFQHDYIDDIKQVILLALEHCEAEGKIKIFKGVATASLRWNETILIENSNEQLMVLLNFINEIITPHLIWKAGKSAESVRTMATATLCSLCQGANENLIKQILPTIMVQLISLIDDNNVGTRGYTLRILNHMGPQNFENLKLLCSGLLSRLDDISLEVREKAAKCLGLLALCEKETAEDEINKSWEFLLKQVISIMMLHTENPEINLRKLLIESLKKLSENNRSIYDEALKNSPINQELKNELQ